MQTRGSRLTIFLHISAWVILLGIPIYNMIRSDVGLEFMWIPYINVIINGIIFYVNYLFIIPKLFFGIKKYKYYLSALLLILAFYFVSEISTRSIVQHNMSNRNYNQPQTQARPDSVMMRDSLFSGYIPPERGDQSGSDQHLNNNPPEGNSNNRSQENIFRFRRPGFRLMHLYNYLFSAFFITFFALGLRVLQRHSYIEKRQKELEKEKLNSELAFLKNQISPHFFFNTLNNIYSLISINTDDSQKAVLQLSRMMRYLLYESEQGEIQLSDEIEFMNNYIDLMRLRMSDKVKLEIEFPSEYENIAIPPLLFIPIIENAFKHGVSYREKSFINIRMNVTKEFLTFNCSNSIVKKTEETEKNHSGIGLDNLRKRLNLLFPGKHEFTINTSDNTFDVLVSINREVKSKSK